MSQFTLFPGILVALRFQVSGKRNTSPETRTLTPEEIQVKCKLLFGILVCMKDAIWVIHIRPT